MDIEHKNHLWAKAIKKEMDNLDRPKVFKYYPLNKDFPKGDGWQEAPMRTIFDVRKGLRRKARVVIGADKIDYSEYTT